MWPILIKMFLKVAFIWSIQPAEAQAGMRMGKKGCLRDFECDIILDARWDGLIISETADMVEFYHTTISRVYRA